jgi:hypothetical protein
MSPFPGALGPVRGHALRFASNREYLVRALQMGLSQFTVKGSEAPVLAHSDRVKYLWVPLPKDRALAPSDQDICVTSTNGNGHQQPREPSTNGNGHQQPRERTKTMANLTRNGTSTPPPSIPVSPLPSVPVARINGNGAEVGAGNLVEQVQGLQQILREALTRTTQLLQGLKHQRKQSRLMRATLASLRQLQQVAE